MLPLREGNVALIKNSTVRSLRLVLNPWKADISLQRDQSLLLSQLGSDTEPIEFDLTSDSVFLFFGGSADLKIRSEQFNDDFRNDPSTGWRGPTAAERRLRPESPMQTQCLVQVPEAPESGHRVTIHRDTAGWEVLYSNPNELLTRVEAVVDDGYVAMVDIGQSEVEILPNLTRVETFALNEDD